jgi:hypothetical protein
MAHVLTSEFFWGVIVGVVLAGVGGFLQVVFQSRQATNERVALFRSFTIDTARNIQRIVADMDDTRRRARAIHPEFLTLLDVEIGAFGRNREHLISLPLPIRDIVRAYMNDCALIRAEIGGGLAQFGRLTTLADQLLTSGNGPHAQRTRDEAGVPLQAANIALDRLVIRSRDATQLIAELQN